MTTFIKVVGWLSILLGTFIGILSGNIYLLILTVLGGMILISLAKLIEVCQQINHKLLGLPLTDNQIRTIIKSSRSYMMESDFLNIYPDNETSYPLIHLDEENYIRAKVFLNYLTQQEYEYNFTFPNRESVTLNSSDTYYKGVDLFAYENQVFVKISKLNLKMVIIKDRIIFE